MAVSIIVSWGSSSRSRGRAATTYREYVGVYGQIPLENEVWVYNPPKCNNFWLFL